MFFLLYPYINPPVPTPGAEKTHLCCSRGMTRNVSGQSSDNLRGSPSCAAALYRHNNSHEWVSHQRRARRLTLISPTWMVVYFFLIWHIVGESGQSFYKEGTVVLSWQGENIPTLPPPHSPFQPTHHHPLDFNIQQLMDLMRNLWMEILAAALIWLCSFSTLRRSVTQKQWGSTSGTLNGSFYNSWENAVELHRNYSFLALIAAADNCTTLTMQDRAGAFYVCVLVPLFPL